MIENSLLINMQNYEGCDLSIFFVIAIKVKIYFTLSLNTKRKLIKIEFNEKMEERDRRGETEMGET